MDEWVGRRCAHGSTSHIVVIDVGYKIDARYASVGKTLR